MDFVVSKPEVFLCFGNWNWHWHTSSFWASSAKPDLRDTQNKQMSWLKETVTETKDNSGDWSPACCKRYRIMAGMMSTEDAKHNFICLAFEFLCIYYIHSFFLQERPIFEPRPRWMSLNLLRIPISNVLKIVLNNNIVSIVCTFVFIVCTNHPEVQTRFII